MEAKTMIKKQKMIDLKKGFFFQGKQLLNTKLSQNNGI
jgi:hypothetical protein